MVEILEQPGLASEMKRDSHCPHCGAHERYHASVRQPNYTEHPCPTCHSITRLYRDENGTLTTSGECAHFAHVALVDGVEVVEFKKPEFWAFGPGRLATP